MSGTQYLRKKLLDHVNSVATYSPAAHYLALLASDPTELGSFLTEVTGTGYARQALAGVMGAADLASGISVNTSIISFGPAGSDWGTNAYLAIADALTGGTLVMPGALNAPRTITIGQPFQIPVGALRFRVT